MKKFLLITIFTASLFVTAQQVGINDTGNAPDLSAGLDVAFSDKGVLVPRMDVTNRNNISNPANGLIVYNTDCNILNYYDCDTWREVREIFGFPNQANGLEIVSGNTNPSQNQQGVVYSVPPITGAVTYSWTLPNGASIATGAGTNRITVDFTTPGDGYVCVSAVNSCGTEVKACLLVDICPLPTVAPIAGNATPNQSQSGLTYSISPVAGANSYNWTVPTGATITAGQNSTSITVDFSPSAQNGDICVTATDDCGTSLPQCLTLTLGSCPMPNVPVAAAETNLTLNDFDANWSAANGAVDYYLDVATDANFTTFLPGYNNKNVGNNLTDNVSGLTCATDYYYRVRAENACGTTTSSNVIQVTINPMASTPVATAGTNINATDFDANWNASANATSYYIDVSDDAGFSNLIVNNLNVGNVLTYNVSGLSCNTDYYYRVRAENSCGTTGNSNDITVTTGSCCVSGPGSVTFSYTGSQQQWTVPNLCNNTVTLEVWGADGGDNLAPNTGGKGGYSTGTINAVASSTYYIYVGGKGTTGVGASGGYNGGGTSASYSTPRNGSGGGATHIASTSGLLSSLSGNQQAVVIVGGGGGGSGSNHGTTTLLDLGGKGGGLTGGNGLTGNYGGTGGTQSAGGTGTIQNGSFGQGGNNSGNNTGGGGGGGWYGGGAAQWEGSGGGSGYIGGVSGGVTVQHGQSGFVANPDVSGDGFVRITW